MNTVLDIIRRFLVRLRERVRIRKRARQQPVETFIMFIGTVGGTEDERRQVLFEGTKLAYRTYSWNDERICETLYESKGRLLVHVQTLYRVEGLRTEYELRELSERELRTEFPELSGLRSPLRLEEALSEKSHLLPNRV